MNNLHFEKLLKGDISTLAQSITLVESSLDSDKKKANYLIKKCSKLERKSFRICISGAPGVGKSTFINILLKYLLKKNKKIAVLAIDPSSDKSKGSILGDKTRMTSFTNNKKIFIRPSPSKGELGGVSKKTRESIILCEAAGFDIIIVETTGVGQTEITAKNTTDFFILLTIPNSGDHLQAIKKGIMEIADLIIINKIDTISNLNIQKEKNYYSQIKDEQKYKYQKIQTCSSKKEEGIQNICNILIENYFSKLKNGELIKNRKNQLEYWLHKSIKEKLLDKFYGQKNINQEISKITEKIKNEKGSIEDFSTKIVDKYLK